MAKKKKTTKRPKSEAERQREMSHEELLDYMRRKYEKDLKKIRDGKE